MRFVLLFRECLNQIGWRKRKEHLDKVGILVQDDPVWQIAAEKQAKDGVPEYPWNTLLEDYDMYDERRQRQLNENMDEYGEEEMEEEDVGGEGGEDEMFEGEYGEEEQEEMSV